MTLGMSLVSRTVPGAELARALDGFQRIVHPLSE